MTGQGAQAESDRREATKAQDPGATRSWRDSVSTCVFGGSPVPPTAWFWTRGFDTEKD